MSEKTLIIAEKPSVAADLARVLPGTFKKTRSHFESDRYIVSYAIGHLVSICYPEEIDPRYQKWRMGDLPILPEQFPLKVLDATKRQFNALQKLIRRKDVTTIINACDAGREGELIFKYIISCAWNTAVAKKSMKRLWLQSMTDEAIKSGFSMLRANEDMVPLEDTALCRSESDWLIGINATRALTAYRSRFGGFFKTPCGRVQTPTLSMLVKREQERLEFKPTDYFTIEATFGFNGNRYVGKWFDTAFKKDQADAHKRADRIWRRETAEAIVAKCDAKPARVSDSSKKTSQAPPQLYDLTSLQREANGRFGFSAQNTLSIAQALYERHKLLTYPRTDSRYLPRDYVKTSASIVATQQNWKYAEHAKTVLDKHYIKTNPRIFDDRKITDHHAIIPTSRLPASLSEPELKIYTMVVQRFLAVFFPAAEYLKTRRVSVVEQESFLSEGKILQKPGWKVVYLSGKQETGEGIIEPVPAGKHVVCESIELQENETKPPPRFNEATLLSAMENSGKLLDDDELVEAMKERGLGTPATRASIIEKLIKDKYLVRDGKELAPTGKAFDLLSLLEAMKIDVLASPEMTGEWEFKLNQILKGSFTRSRFMEEIRRLTEEIALRIKNYAENPKRREASFSPVNGMVIKETPTAYVNEDETMMIRKILGGRVMKEDEIIRLISGETIGPFSNFRSKKGKPFVASLKLKDRKIEFLFLDSNSDLDIDEVKKNGSLGLSPIDQTPVYETPTGYLSESAMNGDDKKGLRISKVILSKPITEADIKKLLQDGKSPLIKGFISKKRKPFDAYLLLDAKGRISFEFPPRKPRRTRKKS
jgi:DNA topoisomerase-3